MLDIITKTVDFVRQHEDIHYGRGAARILELMDKHFESGKLRDKIDAAECAKRAYAALIEYHGSETTEIFLNSPEDKDWRNPKGYVVSYESGPYDWAIQTSMCMIDLTGRLCEPYHGFDLCFYVNE